jgi:hypothetical protein
MDYAETLVGLPYRWFDADVDKFEGGDKFWCENSPPPEAEEIRVSDKSIVCSGLINLLRRRLNLSIPGINGNIRGKYKTIYEQFPGGTGAWFAYLHQNKRLEKINLNLRYPKGTLLLAKFVSNELDQGHVAIIYDDVDEYKNITHQQIIHSAPHIYYNDRASHKNHGSVRIEPFAISNDAWKQGKKSYYTHICLPDNWLILD